MPNNLPGVYIGTSGFSIARHVAPGSQPGLSGLQRYAELFNAVEINSTFYRPPRSSTIERWCAQTPPEFRFAVKLPRSITHEAGLVGVVRELRAFCELIVGFGAKLGPVLVQLPPSLELDRRAVQRFLAHLARHSAAAVALEPRHPSWFSADVERWLVALGVARVAADPACCETATSPPAGRGVTYYRWHGSPRKYFSAYSPDALRALAARIVDQRRDGGAGSEVYCFFDNTALGAAPVNAISLQTEVSAAAPDVTRQAGVEAPPTPLKRGRAPEEQHFGHAKTDNLRSRRPG